MNPRISVLFFALVSVFLWQNCSEVDLSKVDNLNNGRILVVGHGGAGFQSMVNPFNPLPANSMASIEKALEWDVDGLELDLQLSSDNQIVLFHDPDLQSETDLNGCVGDYTVTQLTSTAYRTGFIYDLFQSENIATLGQGLKLINSTESTPLLYLDLKIFDDCLPDHGNLMEVMFSTLDHYRYPLHKVTVISDRADMLEMIKNSYPSVTVMIDATNFDTGYFMAIESNLQGVVIEKSVFTMEDSKKAHDRGLQVVAYGGKSRSALISTIEKNPDVMQVNHPQRLLNILK